MVNTTDLGPMSSTMVMNNLFPALVQCFAVILLGYLAGRFGLLTSIQAKGLGIYLSNFALPALFLKVLISIDFDDVSWKFVLAVSLAKAVVFVIIALFVILLTRPINLGMVGILSCFATQSNDVALGYPILQVLYPQFADYVYLFAPAQLVVLNPISFIFLEWHVQKTREIASSEPRPRFFAARRACIVLRDVMLNPLVWCTFLGIILNFVVDHKLPEILDSILKVLADSFSATALFYLGINMVGKMGSLDRRGIYLVVFMLLAKQLFMPFVTRQIVSAFDACSSMNKTVDCNIVGFLYGALPTAPPVFLFAYQYQVIPDAIATGLVLGTFLSGPLMYISARLVSIPVASIMDYDYLLSTTSFNISLLSLIGCIWVFILFILTKRVCRVPQTFTTCLIISILLACFGLIIGKAIPLTPAETENQMAFLRTRILRNTVPDEFNISSLLKGNGHDKWVDNQLSPATWAHYLQFIVFFVGVTGARIWTALLAMVLAILHMRSLCYLLRIRYWIYLFGFASPILITGTLLITSGQQIVREIDPAFQYGRHQLITSTFVLIVTILATLIFLVLMQRNSLDSSFSSTNDSSSYNLSKELSNLEMSPSLSSTPLAKSSRKYKRITDEPLPDLNDDDLKGHKGVASDETITAEDVDLESWMAARICPQDVSTAEKRRQCITLLARYRGSLSGSSVAWPGGFDGDSTKENEMKEEFQLQNHTVLIILLLITMFFGLFLCIWRLIQEQITGIYIELEFLDSVFNFGQGVIVFAVFGLDHHLIVIPFKKRISKLLFGEVVYIPPEEFLDTDLRRTRDRFVKFHLKKCEDAIVGAGRHRLTSHNKVFQGSSLVTWLLEVGLVHDRLEGVGYGEQLLCGRVLTHLDNRYHFRDDTTLYRFILGSPSSSPTPVTADDQQD